jgi:hypothetical protein
LSRAFSRHLIDTLTITLSRKLESGTLMHVPIEFSSWLFLLRESYCVSPIASLLRYIHESLACPVLRRGQGAGSQIDVIDDVMQGTFYRS